MKLPHVSIRVGKSFALARAVREFLLSTNLGYTDDGTPDIAELSFHRGSDDGAITIYPSAGQIYYGGEDDDAIQIDARTEMGKQIKLLERKDVGIGNVAYDDGNKNHNGIISPDGKSIKIGCSTVTYEKVEEVYNAMQKIQNNQ